MWFLTMKIMAPASRTPCRYRANLKSATTIENDAFDARSVQRASLPTPGQGGEIDASRSKTALNIIARQCAQAMLGNDFGNIR